MNKLLVGFTIFASMSSFANDFDCSIYATTTSSSSPEVITLKVDGEKVQFGSNDRRRGQWSLSLSRENIDGIEVLGLSLVTGRQNAEVVSSRVDPTARLIGLSLNTNLFADVMCVKN